MKSVTPVPSPVGPVLGAHKFMGSIKLRFALILALTALALWMLAFSIYAATNTKVQLTTSTAGPREVEDSTAQAVARDYAKAWQAMCAARSENRPDLLSGMYTGYAQDELTRAIHDQQAANIRTRYRDHGHKLEAIFYSQEGSALQLHDSARVTVEILDGNTVVHSEDTMIHYLVLMTPTADHWQVRKLQAVPSF